MWRGMLCPEGRIRIGHPFLSRLYIREEFDYKPSCLNNSLIVTNQLHCYTIQTSTLGRGPVEKDDMCHFIINTFFASRQVNPSAALTGISSSGESSGQKRT